MGIGKTSSKDWRSAIIRIPALVVLASVLFAGSAGARTWVVDGKGTINYTSPILTAVPYKNIMANETAGNPIDVGYMTTVATPVEIFRFYQPANYPIDTKVSANISGRVKWKAASASDVVSVSIVDYNPANGAKTAIGSAQFTATLGNNPNAYSFVMANPQYWIVAGHRLMYRVSAITPAAGEVRLYFNDGITGINVTEIPILSNVSGYVTNASGYPLYNATVQANTSLSATTDETGFYRLEGLPVGTYAVSTSYPGYNPGSIAVSTTDVDITNASMSLVPLSALSGYVTSASTGLPLGGVWVYGSGLSTTTDAAGFYGFNGLYIGTYTLTTYYSGYNPGSITVNINGTDVTNANISLSVSSGGDGGRRRR